MTSPSLPPQPLLLPTDADMGISATSATNSCPTSRRPRVSPRRSPPADSMYTILMHLLAPAALCHAMPCHAHAMHTPPAPAPRTDALAIPHVGRAIDPAAHALCACSTCAR